MERAVFAQRELVKVDEGPQLNQLGGKQPVQKLVCAAVHVCIPIHCWGHALLFMKGGGQAGVEEPGMKAKGVFPGSRVLLNVRVRFDKL